MKKLLILTALITLIAFVQACSETNKYIVETPTLNPEETTYVHNSAPSMVLYTVERLLEESDVIAEIEIVESLGETDYPSPITYFQTNVITVIKGDQNLQSLKLMQGVNSSYQYQGYPIFIPGQKFILFLAKASDDQYENDMYWIMGGYLTVIRIDTVNDKEYAYKLFMTFKDFIFDNEENAFKSLVYEKEELIGELRTIIPEN